MEGGREKRWAVELRKKMLADSFILQESAGDC